MKTATRSFGSAAPRVALPFALSGLFLVVALLGGCGDDKETTPDTTAPTVSITSPSSNAVVRDSVVITVSASDNRGIAAIDFFVDGDSLTSVTRKPYEAVWQLAGEPFGAHELHCRARDTSGNETTSETVTVTVSDVIFTANFISDWLLQGQGTGAFFVSDPGGTVLAEATWAGNVSLDVEAAAGVTVVPGEVSVTVATQDADAQQVSIVTNRGVAPGAWTWKGKPRPDFGEAPPEVTINFLNMPNHIGYVVSSPWADAHADDSALPPQLTFPLHDQSNDIFVMVGTRSGSARHKTFAGVTTGGTGQFDADLTSLTNAAVKSVALPTASTGYDAKLFGFPTAASRHAGVYLLSGDSSESGETSTTLFYPSGRYTDYKTLIHVDEDAAGNTYWSNIRFGTLPSSFNAIDADLQFADEAPDNFSMVVAGQVDQIRSCWEAQVGGVQFRWFVYSRRSDRTYALPELPDVFVTLFGDVTRDAFTLVYADLIDYPNLAGYDEVIADTFSSATYFYNAIDEVRIKGRWASGAAHAGRIEHHNNTRDAFEGLR